MTEDDADAFARPDGVGDGFAPRAEEPVYTPPPVTASPEERAVFSRPAGAEAFAPLPGERIAPHSTPPAPVPPVMAQVFGATPQASGGFDPAPGTRIAPTGSAPDAPWWKADAARDPWRDPAAPFWLGSGAVFPGGRPEQLAPDEDEETADVPVPPDEDAAGEPAAVPALRRVGLRAVTFLAIVGLLAGAIGGGIGFWLSDRTKDALHREVTLAKTGKPANRPAGSVADLAKRVGPAVVLIAAFTDSGYAVGSGVVIDKNGYVLTNNHVIASAVAGNGNIVVTFSDEATAKARVVGQDASSDIAILKVPTTDLTVASLGDSDKLAVGDPVIAIGSPLALQGTVTSGIVSALHRPVRPVDESGNPGVAVIDAIQTDAAINPGNSGGALIDASGAVVGINAAGETQVSGIGFAIPINYARTIAQSLIRTGKAVQATLGAQGRSAMTPDALHVGAYLEQITPDGPAAKAGLRPADVVVVADGRPVTGFDDLVVVVQDHKPGDTINVTYYRGGAKRTVAVTLGSG